MYMNFWSTYAKNTATYRLVDLNSTWRNKTRSTSPETDIIHVFNAAKRYDDLTFIHSRLHRARVCMKFFERMIKNRNTTTSWIVIIARGKNQIHKTNKQYARRVRSDLHSCLAYKWRTWYVSLQTDTDIVPTIICLICDFICLALRRVGVFFRQNTIRIKG